MKILHTADWHIGKVLHKYPLREDFILFFEWLISIIDREQIEVLLVSGDVFDLANPAAIDRKLYYTVLHTLSQKNIRIIITGGNHDAIGVLNAPKELLESLHITVIGGATDNLEDELIPIYDKNGALSLVVAAVPFLRDKDLRHLDTEAQFKNRTEAIRAGIQKHYYDLGELAAQKYPGIPKIAMGHLYAAGVDSSDSERDIHMGNSARVGADSFGERFDYVALGHIHKPQIIANNPKIRYSGSPIALSFSEKKDQKCVLILNLTETGIENPEIVEVPKNRAMIRYTGSLEAVSASLSAHEQSHALASLVEIQVQEDTYNALFIQEKEALVASYQDNTSLRILKSSIDFKTGARDTANLFQANQNIEDLAPKEVFHKMIASQDIDLAAQKALVEAFTELLEMDTESNEN